jgi:hypothetical protein
MALFSTSVAFSYDVCLDEVFTTASLYVCPSDIEMSVLIKYGTEYGNILYYFVAIQLRVENKRRLNALLG